LLSSAAVADEDDDEVEEEDELKSRVGYSFFCFNLCKELVDDELESGEDEDTENKSLLRVDIFVLFFDSLQQQFDEELHELVEDAVDEEGAFFFCFMEFIEFFNFSFSNCKYLICSFCSFILL
jgi:hypothetical protein